MDAFNVTAVLEQSVSECHIKLAQTKSCAGGMITYSNVTELRLKKNEKKYDTELFVSFNADTLVKWLSQMNHAASTTNMLILHKKKVDLIPYKGGGM